jgi:hypothetical protein
MKRLLTLLLVWNTCFAQVPDNAVVSLNNVASVIGCEKSLSACFANANPSGFDSRYAKSGDWLSEFRNYTHASSWGYFAGTGSMGTLVLNNFSSTEMKVVGEFIITDKTSTMFIFGIGDETGNDIFSVYYLDNYDNIGFTKGTLYYRDFDHDGKIKLNTKYRFEARFTTSNISIQLTEDGTNLGWNSWTQSYSPLQEPTYRYFNLGAYFVNSADAFKGYIRNVNVYANDSFVGGVGDTWLTSPDSTPYTPVNVTEGSI